MTCFCVPAYELLGTTTQSASGLTRSGSSVSCTIGLAGQGSFTCSRRGNNTCTPPILLMMSWKHTRSQSSTLLGWLKKLWSLDAHKNASVQQDLDSIMIIIIQKLLTLLRLYNLKAKSFTQGEWYSCRGLAVVANSGVSTLGLRLYSEDT